MKGYLVLHSIDKVLINVVDSKKEEVHNGITLLVV
jgi:hypothetical protein